MHGLRVFRRSFKTRRFFRFAILPLVDSLQFEGTSRRASIGWGWRCGPHVTLNVGPESSASPISRQIADRLSKGALSYRGEEFSDEQFLKRAGILARLEGKEATRDDLAPRPTGHLEWGDFRPPLTRKLFSEPSLYVGNVLLPVLKRLAEEEDPVSFEFLLLEAFASMADARPSRLDYGSLSFRSHAEAFILWGERVGIDYRKRFDQQLERLSPKVLRLIKNRFLGVVDSEGESMCSAFSSAMGYLMACVDSEVITPKLLNSLVPQKSENLRQLSPFHASLEELGIMDNPAREFTAYRFLLNAFYATLPLLDVTPVQRYFICYAVAELTDRARGYGWRPKLEEMARAQGKRVSEELVL